jgi:hypothetical protein
MDLYQQLYLWSRRFSQPQPHPPTPTQQVSVKALSVTFYSDTALSKTKEQLHWNRAAALTAVKVKLHQQ